jgi:hypothetical protein
VGDNGGGSGAEDGDGNDDGDDDDDDGGGDDDDDGDDIDDDDGDNEVGSDDDIVCGCRFQWSHSGPVRGLACIKWFARNGSNGWNDNYLCGEQRNSK